MTTIERRIEDLEHAQVVQDAPPLALALTPILERPGEQCEDRPGVIVLRPNRPEMST